MAENISDREQASVHQTVPSSSRRDAPISRIAQHEHQIANADQPSSSRHDALVSGTAQRQILKPEQPSTSRHNSHVDEQRQLSDQASSSGKDTRNYAAAQGGQQIRSQNQLASKRRDIGNDRATGRGLKEGYRNLPSTSRHHTATDLTDEDEHQDSSEKASQNLPRKEDIEVLTAGMNKLPPPCWGDERIFLPLVQEQLAEEEYFRCQEQGMADVWGMYGKEREALAANITPEPDETWTPEFEEEEILERETPLWEEIWVRSVIGGEAWMRDILDEDETWPLKEPKEADIWMGDQGGMLSSTVLKRLIPIFNLQESLK